MRPAAACSTFVFACAALTACDPYWLVTGTGPNGSGTVLTAATGHAAPPKDWGDFRFGLVSDAKEIFNIRMAVARAEGIQLDYRYAYVNGGPDTLTNACSWLFGSWANGYVLGSTVLGMRPAFVIYMLQEDRGMAALAANAMDTAFLAKYFATLKFVATRANGHHAIFVVEPDTWGYIQQAGLDPRSQPSAIASLVPQYPFLAGLSGDYSGLAQGIIRALKHYAPDGYAGALMSHWAVDGEACPGPATPDDYMGMPYLDTADVDCSADRTAAFSRALLGDGADRGDFTGVEKNGHSAGWWYGFLQGSEAYRRMYYWDDARMANFIRWSGRLGRGTGLPILGWQISIGSPGLPNACLPGPLSDTVRFGLETGNCAYEDSFFPYFFTHVKEFLDAGFIGFLAGKGLGDDTDFQPVLLGSGGDGGWFFGQLKAFDRGRPWLR